MADSYRFGSALLVCALGCSAGSGDARGAHAADGNAQAGATSSAAGSTSGPSLQLPPDGSSTASSPDACIELQVVFERATPTVMLLIDQSNTMTIRFEDGAMGRSRWNTVRDVLTDPISGLIPKLQSSVRFGLALYSAKDPTHCPALTEVGFALDNYQAIYDVYAAQEVLDHTPTSESLKSVAAELAKYPEPGPKAIVLATDGNPDNCQNLDDNNSPDGGAVSKALVVAAVEQAFSQGISTFVISVGDEIAEQHLQDLAKAGRGGAADASFYRALDTNVLESAFGSILTSVQSCDFTLNGIVQSSDAPRGSVELDGVELGYGAVDGWDMPTSDVVRLHGEACESAKLSADSLAIQFPCGTIVPH